MIKKNSVITLAGVKHCGKSTLGRKLAAKCGFAFYDADDELEKLHGRNTRELFKAVGEEEFRRLEAEMLAILSEKEESKVVSLGGGAVTNKFVTSDTWQKLFPVVMIDIDDITAARRVFARGVPAYLEKYSDPEQMLKEINGERRKVMQKFSKAVYQADNRLSADEQAERFEQFLKDEGIL